MSRYFSGFYNRLPNTSQYFTRRYWRPDRKGYNSGPLVTSNKQINTGYNQTSTKIIPQNIINTLWIKYINLSKFFINNKKRTINFTNNKDEFIRKISQGYICNGEIKNDFVVNADIDTTNPDNNDRNTNWFLTMNKNESTPTLRQNCIESNNQQRRIVGGKKHKRTQNKRSKNKSKTQKIKSNRK